MVGSAAFAYTNSKLDQLPDDFVYLDEIDPDIIQNLRCATEENFTGSVVEGYKANRVIIKRVAAEALAKAHEFLKSKGYNFVIYDAYRPHRAVEYFVNWAKNNDISAKEKYYPDLDKGVLFEKGYISETSQHCKGYTFDLSIIKVGESIHAPEIIKRKLSNGLEVTYLDDGSVDMGTGFDFFHPSSHHDAGGVDGEWLKNREFLKSVMVKFGFEPYQNEWWHYTYKDRDDDKDYDFEIQ